MLEVIWEATLAICSFIFFFFDTFYLKNWLHPIHFSEVKFQISVSGERCKIWPRCFPTNHIQGVLTWSCRLAALFWKAFPSLLGFSILIWFTDLPLVPICFKIWTCSYDASMRWSGFDSQANTDTHGTTKPKVLDSLARDFRLMLLLLLNDREYHFFWNVFSVLSETARKLLMHDVFPWLSRTKNVLTCKSVCTEIRLSLSLISLPFKWIYQFLILPVWL